MTAPPEARGFFVAGGTLRPDTPSYVKRPADDELYDLALAGEFCYVLTPRQMGKSSLMIRTARRLQERGVRTAIIDLTRIGTEVSVEQWYLSLLSQLRRTLRLSVDPISWWQERIGVGDVLRFIDYLHDVVLTEVPEGVVIFIDEIDTTLNLNFRDDFFAAIRAVYNARAEDAEFARLTFVLLGVASPPELIKDRTRTPFNIGHAISLDEFSAADARVLQAGLRDEHPDQGAAIFARIYYWTHGHPYLTQKLCLAVAQSADRSWTDQRVDDLVHRLFLTEEVRNEANLKFVQDKILTHPQRQELLKLYWLVRQGKKVDDDEQSPAHIQLKLAGLVKTEATQLVVRNEIYRRVFGPAWIRANTPVDWTRRIAMISTLLVVLLVAALGFYFSRQGQMKIEAQAKLLIDQCHSASSADQRFDCLTRLFELPDYEATAREIFQELSPQNRLALFKPPDLQRVEQQLINLVTGLYVGLQDNAQDNELLDAMAQALRSLDDQMAEIRANEIEQWLTGRSFCAAGQHQQAAVAYGVAIGLNDRNPGTHFDRARALAELGKYDAALDDLEEALRLAEVLRLDEGWQAQVKQVLTEDGMLCCRLRAKEDEYPGLIPLRPEPKSVTITLFEELYTMNPLYTGMWFSRGTYEFWLTPMWFFDDKLKMEPELVAKIPSVENGGLSDDRLIITFTFSDTAVWSDGVPVTSDDYVFTYEMIMAEGNAVQTRYPWDTFVESVTALDDQTIQIVMSEPYAAWNIGLNVPMLPKHVLQPIFEAEGTIDSAEWNRNPKVGVGPFVFKEWVDASHLVFEANCDYWRGKPNVDRIFIRVTPDDEADIDARVASGGGGWTESWFFNIISEELAVENGLEPGHVALQDKRVRKAIIMGVDRQQIIDELFDGKYEVPVSLWWYDTAYEDPDLKPWPYDPEQAKDQLDEAGWVDSNGDGTRDKDGVELVLRYSTTAGNELREATQVVVQQMLAEIGVGIEILNYSYGVIWNSFDDGGPIAAGEYDIAEWSTIPWDYPDPNTGNWLCEEIPSYVFSVPLNHADTLDLGQLSADLQQEFTKNSIELGQSAIVEVIEPGGAWKIVEDGDAGSTYIIRAGSEALDVYPSEDNEDNHAGGNWQGVCIKELDELFHDQAVTADTAKRIEMFHEIQRIIREEALWMGVRSDPDMWALNDRVENVRFGGGNYPFWNAYEWDVSP